jgi:signal transduction histidine kinase
VACTVFCAATAYCFLSLAGLTLVVSSSGEAFFPGGLDAFVFGAAFLLLFAGLCALLQAVLCAARGGAIPHGQQALLLEAMEDGIMALGPNGIISYMNAAAGRIVHVPPELLVGRHVHGAFRFCRFDEQSAGREESPLLPCLARGVGAHFRGQLLWRADGSSFVGDLGLYPLDTGAKARLSMLRLRDVTDEREAAEAAANARGRFLAMAGHEVRAPLNGIMGLLQLILLHEVESGLKGHLNSAFSLCKGLLQILNDVLDFSRMESASLSIPAEEFSLADAAQAALVSFHELAEEKGLSLRCDMDPSLPETLSGDAGRVRRLLLNLVGNAVKYTREGQIELDVLRVPARDAMTIRVLFVVSDTGAGIPADGMAGIFEPFQRGDEEYVLRQRGVGLGLPIVRRLARLMRGELCVFSRTGQGTEIHLLLPFAPPAAGAASASAA